MPSSFSPTQAELSLVNQIFTQNDTQKLGIITGDVAVRVFGGAKLQPTVLGEIWSIADEENNGWLSRKGIAIALRLIGWAQKGDKINPELINKPGPLAVIDGISSVSTQNTGMSIPRSPPPIPGLPPFTPQDRTKFLGMFSKSGPKDGLLSGEQARDIFLRSRLSNDKLLQIWNLADTQDRGALDSTDFAIGMYLIQGVMSNQIPVLPTSLPPGLYQQASGAATASVRTHATGTSGSFSPSATQTSFPQNRGYVQPQYTGQMLQPQGTGTVAQKSISIAPTLPARKVTTPSSIGSSAFNTAPHWDVTAADKAASDGYFDTLDTTKQGYIEGEIAVPFMLESKLPGEVLAQVWDLADLNNDGRLTREGFAVAMHLIQKKLAGGEIPSTLPPSLIPPSMRQANASLTQSSFSPPGQQTQQAPATELQKDLFSFDDSPPPSAAPSAGPFNVPMQAIGSQTQQSSTFASPSNFASPSIFASPSASQDPFTSSASKDLLGDDDEHANTAKSHPLEDQSAEIGNTQNQLNSTNKSLATTKNERVSVEQTLANQAAQLSALQTQLSSAKAAYETETKLLDALKERHATQTAEIEKSRTELITAESDLSAMRVEKSEIEGSFLRDKEEVRELNRKAFEASQQIETLKAEIEKAKKEAKQQKGLLAIAKKQLSSKEAERIKVEKELAEAQAAAAAAAQEKEEVEAELERVTNSIPVIPPAVAEPAVSEPTPPDRTTSEDSVTFAAAHALPLTPEIGSPAGKSNNPFERLAKSDSSSPRPQSPFLPFSNAAVPSPSVLNGSAEKAAEVQLDDPFGFSQAFEAPVAPATSEDANGLEFGNQTPKPVPASFEVYEQSPMTPTTAHTEEFTTPPTTADAGSPNRQSTEEMLNSVFPDVNASTSTPTPATVETLSTPSRMPGEFTSNEVHETDLGAPLREVEVEESDSSDEEDEVPLATLKAKSTDIAEPEAKSADAPVANGQAKTASFDEIFGVSTPNGQPAPAEEIDAFGLPVKTDATIGTEPTTSYVASPTEAGVNAFDEAMNKISSNGPTGTSSSAAPTSASRFSFDAAFDDNFDFGSAKAADAASSFPPASNGIPSATTDGSDGFDSLFVTPPSSRNTASSAVRPVSTFLPNVGTSSSPPSATPATAPSAATGPSFDEVFAGFDTSGPAIQLDAPATQASSTPTPRPIPVPSPVPAVAAKAPESPTQKAFPVTTSSPSQSSVTRSVSPPLRQRSPPVRTGSPKPRPSTASSKDGHEKEKNPPARHSKLSLRLPFGKKKKQEAVPPPPPSQFLTPPAEEPERTNTPAVDDDVEAVKQLTAMGFSRSQAVAALEKYAYDVPRALNSLLGQP
ncbi:hypothetical protein GYMLUDRAFT_196623 [Collybiopsis luxurians FD-317 M1]|uniref:Actin cytoskeleton-regulatory complex protein PAN1 n=1 Tax=Collybiopsis luxurians FD-317 M1 TaxID=944289 RepID=A0A0D0CVM7_9AGAR|nr:hypothetical protein GYMLUDRAFT_196623 [Collybiopsis luxurians FD-317 M1]